MSETITIDVEILEEIIIGRVEPQIYAFTTETIPNYLKVGDTYRPLETRLNEWRKHFPNLKKKFEAIAKVDDDTFFRDFAVHNFLEHVKKRARLTPSAIDDIPYYSKEFFKNATEDDLNDAIEDIKLCHDNNETKYQYYKFDESHIPITHTYARTATYEPRPNQEETINKFKKAIENGENNLLMYAVMRFGKSFTSMCCAVEMDAKFVIVVSAKADVKSEWKKTVESHTRFKGYNFLDSDSLNKSESIISDKLNSKEKIVLFLTLQDLQGDEIKSRHKEVFDTQIDLLLIDETHFGARASEYGKVLKDNGLVTKEIKNEQKLNETPIDELDDTIKFIDTKVRIHLSGTPYRILMDSEFTDDNTIAFYQFSDIADDQEKWDIENQKKEEVEVQEEWENPYYGFPKMIRFAFNPNKSSRQKMEEMKKHGVTYAFSALFKPQSIIKDKEDNLHKKFEHEEEIIDLLKVIDGSQEDEELLSFLDYDKIKDGKMCRHIVCVLPYRASCDALEELIKSNTFKNLSSYEIINISGVEHDRAYKDTQSVQDKIKECENDNIKTITLTVNKMLTGSTVPQWDTMLYFKDTSSPQEYDQAIFRLQNQYIKTYKEPDGDEVKYNMKPQTLLVDFNPNRMFLIQEQKSQIYNVNTDSSGNSKLEERIKKELDISPIIVLNKNKIVQIEPSDILDAVRKYSSDRSVFDEATTISIDLSLLEIDEIKAVIEKQGKIGSRQGLEIPPTEDDGEDMDAGDMPAEDEEPKEDGDKNTNSKDDDTIDYKGQFAMFYARILFFAFLTDSVVKSLQEIINQIESNKNNLRIALNINLNKDILVILQENINPFVLSELDYKIQNINSLANDSSLKPIQRASNAMKKFSRLSDSEVVTPENIADRIIGILPLEAVDSSKNIVDIAAKQGEFVYAIYKKYGKDVAKNFYSIPTSKIAYEFTRKVYKLLELNMKYIEESHTSYDLIGENEFNMDEEININGSTMKFDVIIGNPPYQQKDGGFGTSAAPIYHEFVEKTKKLNPQYLTMIIPARWFSGGKGLDNFRAEMLNDNKLKEIHDYPEAIDVFPGVQIKGGVCYFLWDRDNSDLCEVTSYKGGKVISSVKRPLLESGAETFIRFNEAISILKKVQKFSEPSIKDQISARKPYGLNTKFKGKKRNFKNALLVYQNGGTGYVSRNEIKKGIDSIEKYKVFIPPLGSGSDAFPHPILGKPFVGDSGSICTETYIIAGVYDNKSYAENLSIYLKSKFLRFMVLLNKPSQHATSKVYHFVPTQDFSYKWNDTKLYKKYNFTSQEIKFIESMIKPMD